MPDGREGGNPSQHYAKFDTFLVLNYMDLTLVVFTIDYLGWEGRGDGLSCLIGR